jgi:predicted ABC-type ATPase
MAAVRPTIFVLAGVNGAGKSSVGGNLLIANKLTWFNPDSYARELVELTGISMEEANGHAWQFGRQQLEAAIAARTNFAFETTLGARTIPDLLLRACTTHNVMTWYCGLDSPELHLARIRARVAAGGHDIPEAKVRERWVHSRLNLIRLLPYFAHLQVFDNSAQVGPGHPVRPPLLQLEMLAGQVLYPDPNDARHMASIAPWAQPVVAAAIKTGPRA